LNTTGLAGIIEGSEKYRRQWRATCKGQRKAILGERERTLVGSAGGKGDREKRKKEVTKTTTAKNNLKLSDVTYNESYISKM
jgi:hypothetical protein